MAHRTIILKGDPIIKEANAGEAGIYPGMGVIRQADGDFEINDSAITLKQPRAVAIEDDLQGSEVGTVYTAANICKAAYLRNGDEIAALFASGQNIDIGEEVTIGTAGKFITCTPATDDVVGVALESSGGALAADTLLKIEVLA